jgi:acyl dehydratase
MQTAITRTREAAMLDQGQLYLDDFVAGQSFNGVSRVLDEASFLKFAELTGDSHPIHYDKDYAAKSKFGARVAHGLLVSSLSALGATPLSARLEESMVAFLGQCFTFVAPVLIDDKVQSHFRVESIEAAPGRSSGTVKFAVILTNQRNETVAEGHHFYMLRRRAAQVAH